MAAGAPEPQLTPTPELKHGFANLIDNAIKFARHQVLHRGAPRRSGGGPHRRRRPGFSPEVLELLGEPYISTTQRSDGLGLGVFIAQTLLARTGATLQFDNLRDGARVTVRWRRATLEELAPEK